MHYLFGRPTISLMLITFFLTATTGAMAGEEHEASKPKRIGKAAPPEGRAHMRRYICQSEDSTKRLVHIEMHYDNNFVTRMVATMLTSQTRESEIADEREQYSGVPLLFNRRINGKDSVRTFSLGEVQFSENAFGSFGTVKWGEFNGNCRRTPDPVKF